MSSSRFSAFSSLVAMVASPFGMGPLTALAAETTRTCPEAAQGARRPRAGLNSSGQRPDNHAGNQARTSRSRPVLQVSDRGRLMDSVDAYFYLAYIGSF